MFMGELSTETNRIGIAVVRYEVATIFATVILLSEFVLHGIVVSELSVHPG